jgi:hypothetical protein
VGVCMYSSPYSQPETAPPPTHTHTEKKTEAI